MPIVVFVRRMMNCMVTCSHNGLHFAMDAIMYVCSPDSCGKQQKLMCQKVHGHKEESPRVGYCLQDTIQGVECKTRKWTQRVLLVVLVMYVMQLAIAHSDVVQETVLPIHKEFDAGHVEYKIEGIFCQPNIRDTSVCQGPPPFDDGLCDCRQRCVQRHCEHGDFYLFQHIPR